MPLVPAPPLYALTRTCACILVQGLVYGIANASGRVCLYAANHHGQVRWRSLPRGVLV
jgi:hypothetical protein